MWATRFVLSLVLVLGATSIALADANQRPAVPSGGCGALIMWYICESRKAKEIGGWLLYYYIQLYVGVILGLILTGVSLRNYLPSSWTVAPDLYPWFLASTVPGILLLPLQLVVAEVLRITRSPKVIRILLIVLWTDLASSLLGAAIDMKFFRDNIGLDVIRVVWPLIWIPYFYRSQRVRRVFVSKDWLAPVPSNTPDDAPAPATLSDAELLIGTQRGLPEDLLRAMDKKGTRDLEAIVARADATEWTDAALRAADEVVRIRRARQ